FFLVVLLLHKSPDYQAKYYGSHDWFSYSVLHMLASLFYAQVLIYKSYPYPNIVLWSLEIEVQFYIVAPLLARAFMIRGKWVRRALFLLFLVLWPNLFQLMFPGQNSDLYGLLGQLQFFLIGFLLADLYLDGWMNPPKKSFVWDGLFLL